MRKKLILISILLLSGVGAFFCLPGCGVLGGNGITEGVIEYDITYPKMDSNNMMASGMPDKAYLRFKNNNMSNDMSAVMGLVSITYISNNDSNKVEQRLTLFGKKYASSIPADYLEKMNGSYLSSIEKGKTTSEIAGYKCKEAIVKLTSGEEIKVFYTNDIGIKSPNWSNPYATIDGVLMDFQMERYGVVMRLRATSVLAQKVEDEAFKVPADSTEFKLISIEELGKILEELNPS
jgi:GLPGLI family protein